MYIGWNYALNLPTLPREVTKVSKNAKDAISAFCSALADLSMSGYGMRYPQQNQFPSVGMPKARGGASEGGDESVVAPPGGEESVVAPQGPVIESTTV